MPEVTVDPEFGGNTLPTGDTWHKDDDILPGSNLTFLNRLEIGITASKAGGNPTQEIYLRHALLSIPMGATVLRAKLEMKAESNSIATITTRMRTMQPDGKWDAASLAQIAQPGIGFRFNMRDTAVAVVGSGPTTSNTDLRIRTDQGQYGFAQAMTLSATGTGLLGSSVLRLQRVAGSPSSTVWVEIWSAVGVAGGYLTGSLLATSDVRTFNSLSTASSDQVFNFTGVNQIAVAAGQVRIVRLVVNPTPASSTPTLRIFTSVTWDGSIDNAICIGPTEGWSNFVYDSPQALDAIVDFEPGLLFDPISLTANVTYTFGDASYSPSQVIALGSIIQQAVSHPSWNGRLALHWSIEGGTPGGERHFWSQNEPGETGPRLTVEWATGVALAADPVGLAAVRAWPGAQPGARTASIHSAGRAGLRGIQDALAAIRAKRAALPAVRIQGKEGRT